MQQLRTLQHKSHGTNNMFSQGKHMTEPLFKISHQKLNKKSILSGMYFHLINLN